MLEILLGVRKSRQVKRSFRNYRLTLLSLLLTVVVLRGTIGAGKFGTPQQDFREIRSHLHFRKNPPEPRHILQEIQTNNYNYNALDINKFLMDEEEDENPNPNEPYSLGPKISNWDEQRENWLIENPEFPNFIRPNMPRILLVSGSSPKPWKIPLGDHYLLKSIKNKVDYCRVHGIEVFYNMALLDVEMAGLWGKLPLIRKLLVSHPEVEFLWWMDADALFTDMTLKIPWERYKDYNLVMHRLNEVGNDQRNWIGLNTGNFLLRNCQWGLDILDAWAAGKKIVSGELEDGPVVETDDQSAMVYLLTTEREKWGNKVYLESDYYLHGYEEILVDKYEEMIKNYHLGFGDHRYHLGFGGQRWPFISQFEDCKPCGNFGDCQYERCLQQMDRAFNYGDNQIQKMYGLTHKSRFSRSGLKRTLRVDE